MTNKYTHGRYALDEVDADVVTYRLTQVGIFLALT